MPLVRLTYAKDIAREGTDLIDVDENRAAALINLRRGVVVPADEIEDLPKAVLVEHAHAVDARVRSHATKAEIVTAIEGAESD
jgi:hypothetical protein